MNFTFVGFNFQSADLAAEESNYRDHHVPLAKSLPGVRQYYTARTMPHRDDKSSLYRHALLMFDSGELATKAYASPAGPALMADTQAHIKDLRNVFFEGDIIVPFENRKPEQQCFLMVAEFNLEKANPDAAEKRYREHHTGIARRLPGLRNYIIGRLNANADRHRIAILAFDSVDAFKDAYRSPVGVELIKDENETIHDGRVIRLDARVEI